jgi:hypothetical protein
MENNLELPDKQTEALSAGEKNKKGVESIQGFLISQVNTIADSVDNYLNNSKDPGLITRRVEVLFDWIEEKMAISH